MVYATGGNRFLHDCDFDEKIKRTHLGQAHYAGTGPAGKTCRECVHFLSPGYYSKSDRDRANTLKDGACRAPMSGKARRRFPHSAMSCLLFEQDPDPKPITKEDTR